MVILLEADVLNRGVSPKHRAGHVFPTHYAEDVSHPCGDHLILFLTVDDTAEPPTILSASFAGNACCLTTAVADMLCENLNGKPFETDFEISEMIQVPYQRNRKSCVELPFKLLRAIYGRTKHP